MCFQALQCEEHISYINSYSSVLEKYISQCRNQPHDNSTTNAKFNHAFSGINTSPNCPQHGPKRESQTEGNSRPSTHSNSINRIHNQPQHSGGLALATDINQMPFEIREPASTSHTVTQIQHNLCRCRLCLVFLTIMKCRYMTKEIQNDHFKGGCDERVESARRKLWRVPVVKENNQATFDNSNTVLVKTSPVELLQNHPQP